MRRYSFVLAIGVFLAVCLYSSIFLYSSLESSSNRRRELYERGKIELGNLEERLKLLEDDLHKNDLLIKEIQTRINNFVVTGVNGSVWGHSIKDDNSGRSPLEREGVSAVNNSALLTKRSSAVVFPPELCSLRTRLGKVTSNVQMLNLYEAMPFDNVDGGPWKQGWRITYDKKDMEEKQPQLQVVVIPHSHCDPGWIKTFETYYTDQVRGILNGMVSALSSEADMKFIYAEISFFERWWRDADQSQRTNIKKLLDNGQFEIVTGAWVMTDEANSFYYATIDQMIEGHVWLQQQLGYKPKNHWSIDPFGLSPTMAYLLKESGFDAMVLQRIHYSVKKHLAEKKQLEFMWRQLWAENKSTTDILTHVFPFYSYDVPHTCGPDPKVCCQFDFRRLNGGGIGCPWGVAPQPISDSNVAERAEILLDQYRKKAQLYRTNVLLVPLGDDFRYEIQNEWTWQHSNYKKLFEFMNSKKEWNVEAKFGTVADYFRLLLGRTSTPPGAKPADFPILSGDFFTYADRDDHYWSGYYTSRPFYKRLDRYLQHYLRTAEILYSIGLAKVRKHASASKGYQKEELFDKLVTARRNMGLFQHHDGITGTAKDHVVVDYGQRMFQSLQDCFRIIESTTQLLLSMNSFNDAVIDANAPLYQISEMMENYETPPSGRTLAIKDGARVITVFNSLTRRRTEIVYINVDSPTAYVIEAGSGLAVDAQLNPVVITNGPSPITISSEIYQLCFVASVDPLSYLSFVISSRKDVNGVNSANVASISSNFDIATTGTFGRAGRSGEQVALSGYQYIVNVDGRSGLMQSISLRNGNDDSGGVGGGPINASKPRACRLKFIKYGARGKNQGPLRGGGDSLSGAYLFLPDGEAKEIDTSANVVLFVQGPLVSYVHVKTPHMVHRLSVSSVPSLDGQSISIRNSVDISREYNFELAMRLETDIASGDTFYTDLNGLHLIKRRRFDKIPLQGNFYPMPSGAFIEDESTRMTLITGQPLAFASLKPGSIEVVMDRILMQDDDRGLFQGVKDNKNTAEYFRLIVEPRTSSSSSSQIDPNGPNGFHTIVAHSTMYSLNYPLVTLFQGQQSSTKILQNKAVIPTVSFGPNGDIPCDVHIVNIRTLPTSGDYSGGGSASGTPTNQHAMILHRFIVDCSSKIVPLLHCNVSTSEHLTLRSLGDVAISSILPTSLTTIYNLTETSANSQLAPIELPPMKVATFVVSIN